MSPESADYPGADTTVTDNSQGYAFHDAFAEPSGGPYTLSAENDGWQTGSVVTNNDGTELPEQDSTLTQSDTYDFPHFYGGTPAPFAGGRLASDLTADSPGYPNTNYLTSAAIGTLQAVYAAAPSAPAPPPPAAGVLGSATPTVVAPSVAAPVSTTPTAPPPASTAAPAGPGSSNTYTPDALNNPSTWDAFWHPQNYGSASNVTQPKWEKGVQTAGLIGLGVVTGGVAGVAVAGAIGEAAAATWLGTLGVGAVSGAVGAGVQDAATQLVGNQPFSAGQLVTSTAFGALGGAVGGAAFKAVGLGAVAGETGDAVGDVGGQTGDAAEQTAVDCGTPDGCFVGGTVVLSAARGRQPIERLAVGRKLNTMPGDAVDVCGPTRDPADYRVITLLYVKPGNGQRVELSLLRHASKVEQLGPGDTVRLTVVELEADGVATVLSVGPSPEIENGPGRLVTGTIRTNFADVRHVKLVGLDEPVGVTAAHPLFSEDEQDFVPVSTLGRGDRLRTRSGVPAVVESVTPAGTDEVFNLEIEEVHQYYVSDLGVLAHNAGTCPIGNNAVDGGPHSETKLPVGDGLDSHHIPPKSVSGLDPEISPAVKVDPLDHRLTLSYGTEAAAVAYRQFIANLLATGQTRLAFAIEIQDLRSIVGNELNSGIQQMLKYAKNIGYLPGR